MSLTAPAQAIQSALLADAEVLVAAEDGAIVSRQIRALAGAVARRLAEIEDRQADVDFHLKRLLEEEV